MQNQGLRALVFGGSGAVGAELVTLLLASSKWQKVHCVVRRPLPEWSQLPGKEKLFLETNEDLDNYFLQASKKYQGYDSLFCCLGSQRKHGEETFIKVDKTYPLLAADIALSNKIPHYLLVSSMGSDHTSWFLYPRTKGEVEEELKKKKMNLLSIFRPGLLRNRRDARTVEKIIGIVPFLPGIETRGCAEVLKMTAERFHEQALKCKEKVQTFQNKEMEKMLQSADK